MLSDANPFKYRRRSKQFIVNLSGKKTFVGRSSGECLHDVNRPRSKHMPWTYQIKSKAYVQLSG